MSPLVRVGKVSLPVLMFAGHRTNPQTSQLQRHFTLAPVGCSETGTAMEYCVHFWIERMNAWDVSDEAIGVRSLVGVCIQLGKLVLVLTLSYCEIALKY